MKFYEIYNILEESNYSILDEAIKPKKWFDYVLIDNVFGNDSFSYEFRNQEDILMHVHFHRFKGGNIFGIGNESIYDLSFETPEESDIITNPVMDLNGRGAIKTLGTIAHITDYAIDKHNIDGIIFTPATTKHDTTKPKTIGGKIVKDKDGKIVRTPNEDFNPHKLNSRGNIYRGITNAMGAKMFDLDFDELENYYIFLKDPKLINIAREKMFPEVDSKGYVREPKYDENGFNHSDFGDILSMNL